MYQNKRQPFQNNYEVISPNRLPYSAVKVTLFKFSLKEVVSLSREHVVGNTHLSFGFSMSGLKLNIISTALQAFLFASSPHLLFTKTVCFYLLPLILPSADLLYAICKPSFIALPDGSGSFTGRQW